MNWTLPGLLLGAALIALINAGVLQGENVPAIVPRLFALLSVVYIIPSVFAFPTAWFLSTGRTRLYKNSTIDLYKKKIVYHKAEKLVMSKPRYNVYSVTQLRSVDVKRGYYVLHGSVTNETSGGSSSELKIPVAFDNMQLILEKARYR
jgi:hypothetical protein